LKLNASLADAEVSAVAVAKADLLLGKHTHSACTKIVSNPILCLYNMKMMNTDQ
jgi:hypothetical protein